MTQYIFLQSDYDDLAAWIEEQKSKVRDIQSQVGESTRFSSESWHDNIDHEELMRRYDLHMTHLVEKEKLFKQAKIVAREKSSNKIGLGSRVTYSDDTGDTHTVTIGSYRQIRDLPGVISYASPLGEALVGHKTGDTITAEFASKKRQLTIDEVDNT